MRMVIMNGSAACSSALLQDIPEGKDENDRFLHDFAYRFWHTNINGYRPFQMAFVCASTLSYQANYRRFLTGTLGFHTTEKSHNTKNKTSPYFSVARVCDLKEKLEELGFPVETTTRPPWIFGAI